MALLTSEAPELTDRNHSDAGIAMMRLLARETDLLNHSVDRANQEASITWAQFRQSLINLGRTVGYLPTLAAAAIDTTRN